MEKNVAIITGANSGIGLEVCKCFLDIGFDCICIDKDISTLKKLDKNKNEIFLLQYDLMINSNYDLIVDKMKKILIEARSITLVNNLGGSNIKNNENVWEKHIDTIHYNLKSLVCLTEEVIKYMKLKKCGKIVNVSSISARYPLEMVKDDYAASKSFVIGYSRSKAKQLSEYGILVNTVCPGIIATERIKDRWANRAEEINQKILSEIPLRRLGLPNEVAKAIRFLGSDENTYITGAILDVNGGMYMP